MREEPGRASPASSLSQLCFHRTSRRRLLLASGWWIHLALAGALAAGAAEILRGPYVQLATPEGAVVRWRTDQPTASRLLYGDDPTSLHSVVEDPAIKTEHMVALTGLTPESRIYYAVGTADEILAGGDEQHYFRSPPFAGTAKPTRVWVLGDSGTADANAASVRDAYVAFNDTRPTDVWLMLGDNAYLHGTDAQMQAAVFETYAAQLRSLFLWPAFGNHDAQSADAATQTGPHFDAFTLPSLGEAGGEPSGTEAYYSFTHGNVHFVCLDSSESIVDPNGAMLEWLEADLAANSQLWTVAYWHHPPYSHGSHNSDNVADSQGLMRDMREKALPLLEAAGVDLVLTGHSHAYERSFLLDGHYGTSDTLTAAMILDGGDGRVDGDGAYFKLDQGHRGAVYVVAGSSGKLGGGTFDHPAMAVSIPALGSLVLDVEGLRLDAAFLTNSGVVEDRFTLVKGPRPELRIGDSEITEGDDQTIAAVFPLTLTGTSLVDVGVNYVTQSLTATGGKDYLSASGTLVIPAGESTASLSIAVMDDLEVESSEHFEIHLGAPRNASLTDAVGRATIRDDDAVIFGDGFESGDTSAWSRRP